MESQYSVLCLPLKEGSFSGQVTFLNEMLGEFWYAIDLTVERAPEVQLTSMLAELGKKEE